MKIYLDGETSPEIALPLGFAGGFVDRHTGFVRFGFRDYDPQVGRFTAQDPIGYTGGDHDLYDYCVDDPVSFIDPEGLMARRVSEENLSKENPEDSTGLKVYQKVKTASDIIDQYEQEKNLAYLIAKGGVKIAAFMADSFAKMFEYPHATNVQEQLENVLKGKDALFRGNSPALKQIYDEAAGKKQKGSIKDEFKK